MPEQFFIARILKAMYWFRSVLNISCFIIWMYLQLQ